ncbi:MAG: hypothetical protein LUH10_14270 [Tannerellaceae bacterium]|nr:hypothetical protein [Tannerellaceae bacterium]
MKRIYLLLLLVVFGFSACEGPAGPPGADGLDSEWYVKFIEVPANKWVLTYDSDGLNPRYEYTEKISQLTDWVYDESVFAAYIIHNYNTSYETQSPLPYVLAAETVYPGNLFYEWIEIIDCNFEIGSVTFYLTYSDFDVSYSPGDRAFRVVLGM